MAAIFGQFPANFRFSGALGRELFNCMFSVQLHQKTTLNNSGDRTWQPLLVSSQPILDFLEPWPWLPWCDKSQNLWLCGITHFVWSWTPHMAAIFGQFPANFRFSGALVPRLHIQFIWPVCTNMSSLPTGCSAVQLAMWKGGGALPTLTGLTDQRIIRF